MERFKRLGVFLHNSPADKAALAFTGLLATLAKSESVLGIHVREPEQDEEDSPQLASFEAEVRQELPEAITRITKVEVHSGSTVPEIWRSARKLDLDMIIVGRRLPSEQLGIGSAFARLARKAPCNVLVVPQYARPHLGRVLVPVDFSPHSKLALEHGLVIAKACGDGHPQVVVVSNASVGYGHHKLGLSLQDAVEQLEKITRQKLEGFVAGVDTAGIDVELLCTCSEQPEAAIQEVAVARKMDLIVVGSRGARSLFMLGSVAERILHHSLLPVLIVKQKGETFHILDALFGSG